jgi:NADH-quinone oxidoreductase E subunit
MALEFSQETLKQFDEVVSRYPETKSAVLPVLFMAQKEFGYLSQEAIEYVAKLMDIPAARLYGIVTFYTMFNMKPVGRHHLQVCRTLPCALLGSERIITYLKKKLSINLGETTPDGKFTLSEVECLASCDTAPVMQINDDYCENLSEEKVDKVIENLK